MWKENKCTCFKIFTCVMFGCRRTFCLHPGTTITSHDYTSVCLVCMSLLLWVGGVLQTRKIYRLACGGLCYLFIFFVFEIPDVSKHCPVGGFRSVCVYTAPTCAPVILAPPLTECSHVDAHPRSGLVALPLMRHFPLREPRGGVVDQLTAEWPHIFKARVSVPSIPLVQNWTFFPSPVWLGAWLFLVHTAEVF